jgi:hypothetical protein
MFALSSNINNFAKLESVFWIGEPLTVPTPCYWSLFEAGPKSGQNQTIIYIRNNEISQIITRTLSGLSE